MHQIGVREHDACAYTQEYRYDCDHVGVDIQFVPEQGKRQTNGAREMHIQPLFSIF